MAKFRVDMNKPTEYDGLAKKTEEKYGLPDGLTKLVLMIENRNKPRRDAVSPAGAEGLMQIMPANKKALGITDSFDPEQAFDGAGKLLSDALKRYDGNVGAALADYNGGPKAAERYLAGQSLHPETKQYLEFAQDYLQSSNPTTSYGDSVINAGLNQAEAQAPSDLYQDEEQPLAAFVTGLDEEAERRLQDEAKFYDLSLNDAIKFGFKDTLTSAITHAVEREEDDNYVLSDEQFNQIKQQFPQGLSADQEDRIRNSRSQSDFDYNINRVQQENDFARRMQTQMGWSAAGAYAGVMAGGIFDPVALPLGTFGAAGRLIKGGSVIASAGRMAAEGAAATAIASPIIQQIDKGSVDAGDVLQHMGMAAAFGAGLGTVIRSPAVKAFDDETMATSQAHIDRDPVYDNPLPQTGDDRLVVNFNAAHDTSVGPSGEIIGVGPTAVSRHAEAWDESSGAASDKVRSLRLSWYNNKYRNKLFGWADSEGVQLAKSNSKVARWVGAMWSGDQAGLGRQQTRTAAVIKEQIKDEMLYEYVPRMKEQFEAYMTPAQKANYMMGGGADIQKAFSREVQLERYRHRLYRAENGGSSQGYVSEAPAPVQRAAAALDELMGKSKKMHLDNETEHASILKDSDSVGYIEQRPDFIRINRATPEERKAFLDMVKDDYHAEATAKINKLRQERAEWIENAYKRAEQDIEAKWVNDFLKDPEQYFDKHVEQLSRKIHMEMDKRASHWWENALRNPEERYQNSEASLLTLAREMSDEWFTGKEVDADMVRDFQTALTKKWSDTSRRELNMTNKRVVNGQDLYLLDMFQHDVFASTVGTANNTAGRVAMAKLGWKTEQDIQDTLTAMYHSGATTREVEAARHISDIILNRAKGLDDQPLVQALSNMTHATMMGKLGQAIIADLPMAIGNIGVGGMFDALGKMANKVIDGSMFVRNGRLTEVGSDLDALTKGLLGHDNELWIPQQINADGYAMELGGSLLRRTAAAARFTNTMSAANAMSKLVGTGVTRASNKKLHTFFKSGKGVSEARLADVGLTSKEISRIKKQFDKYADKENFGLDKWDDPLAKEDLIMAANRFAQQGQMGKSYAGDLPQWTRNTVLGYIYSRFRAIGIKAQEKVLVRNLTLADSNTFAMITGAVAWATFLAYARIYADAATSKDGRKVLKERLTPAGIADQVAKFTSVMGLTSEGTNIWNMLTGGAVQGGSDSPITAYPANVGKAIGAVGGAISGEGSAGKAAAATTKLLPGANTYQMLLLRNALQGE
ncbi:internal virion protein with endolysin domain [Cronobacter phage Dev-CD-23823]|uniref:Lytic glycosylase n=1 Tax=Cronobacter phage Dev-CD-23823 TaxID=1712539 RepID=A0A0K8IY29_9CAUD|nr:internal virion protein with endolysin domain [Cronobacter phage Dev-CD-23823]CUH74615.1 Lytic glycosylase [Cronobacter phage Dev-CD-23823]